MKFLSYFAILLGTFSISAKPQQPNVVFILIDDLSHLGVTAYGSNILRSPQGAFPDTVFQTPNIDRLAHEGLRCDYAYAYPLCEATRIALMSGKNNNRNYHRPKAQHSSDITFGDVFQAQGYETCIVGKWKQTRGSKETAAKDYIFEFGWDEFCCFDVVDAGRRFIHPRLVTNGEEKTFEGIDPETGRRYYGPDIVNRYALDFIDRNKENPFFLYYPMMLVHDEHTPTPDTIPSKAFDTFKLNEKSPYGHNNGDDRRYFPDMLAYTDKLIGKVLKKLEEHKLTENTLIIVMGDNGTKECFTHVLPDGSEFEGGKGSNKENGLHVPLVLRHPKEIPAKTEYKGLVNVTDIYPTLCHAAGIDIPNSEEIDGISFWDQARGKTNTDHRDTIYTWYNGNNTSLDLELKIEYAFDKNFKRYAPDSNFPHGRFFDLRNDWLEESGGDPIKLKKAFNKWHYQGLDFERLDLEQKTAFKKLGQVLEKNRYQALKSLQIVEKNLKLRTGETRKLHCSFQPQTATRKNLIWQSSSPEIAVIDKFGKVKALQKGTTTITVYSWDDAYPLAANTKESFSKSGIQDKITVSISDS